MKKIRKLKSPKLIVCLAVLWIILIIAEYNRLQDETPVLRIVMSLAGGPVLLFSSGIAAMAVSALMACGKWILEKLCDEDEEKILPIGTALTEFFSANIVLFTVILYFFEITGKHFFYRIYGG